MKYKIPKIEELLDAGVHFGHQTKRWHPKMEPFIYGVKRNIHIIDLESTEDCLKKACEFLYQTAKNGGQIIFVGTKKQARETLLIEAKRCGAMYVTERWLGGTITNYKMIKKNIDKLKTFLKNKESGELDRYTKKERILIDREIEKLSKYVGGITNIKGAPEALFVVDPKHEKTAVKEAKKTGIPVVALIDTNSDPGPVDYVIPGNDDALKSIAVILKTVASAVEEGYKDFEKFEEVKAQEVADEVEVVEIVEVEKLVESKDIAEVGKDAIEEAIVSKDEKEEIESKENAKTTKIDEKSKESVDEKKIKKVKKSVVKPKKS